MAAAGVATRAWSCEAAHARGDQRDVRTDLAADGRNFLRTAHQRPRAGTDSERRKPARSVERKSLQADSLQVSGTKRGQNRDRSNVDVRGRFDGSPHHRRSPAGVNREEQRAQRGHRPGRSSHRRRDVMQLQIQEETDSRAPSYRVDHGRAVAAEQLESDLHHRDMR
jgi:hypothetical protein